MTLVNRVSSFFLAALAVALIVYSWLIYCFFSFESYRRFDGQLKASFNALIAAVEVEDDDVKWEPSDHVITLGVDRDLDAIKWAVIDEAGRLVDHSTNLSLTSPEDCELLANVTPARGASDSIDPGVVESTPNDGWRRLRRRLVAPHAKAQDERDALEYDALTIVVGRSPAEVEEELRSLAVMLIVLPLIAWLLAAMLGRWFVRKALRPVSEMATRAASPAAADFRLRLPVSSSKDELSELGSAFNRLLDQLQHAFDRQRRFTGDAAHQLRTPLTVLIGQLDVALRRPRSPDEYVRTMSLLREQAVELQQLVESLLFLARAEQDAAPPDLAPVDLSTWLPQRLERWKSHPRAADVRLEPIAPLVVRASPELLGQVVDNLVGNALKYTPAETPIVVSAGADRTSSADPTAHLAIADSGPGVPEADRQAIFEPFVRTEAARRSGAAGTGLGLAVAARIAAALRGRLICESSATGGARFVLTLPIADARAV